MDHWEGVYYATSGHTVSEPYYYEASPWHGAKEKAKAPAFRERHLQLLKQLLHRALIEGRLGAARDIFKYLLQSSIFVSNEPRLLFRVGAELHWAEDTFDLDVLRFFQAYLKKCPDQAVTILQESTNYHVKHGLVSEAYAKISGHLMSLPYANVAVLHGYAGMLASQLGESDKRQAVSKKHHGRAIAHFADYIARCSLFSTHHFSTQYMDSSGQPPSSMASSGHGLDIVFVKAYCQSLDALGRRRDAIRLIEEITNAGGYAANSQMMALEMVHFEMLKDSLAMADYNEYDNFAMEDRDRIANCIQGMIKTARRTGMAVPANTAQYVIDALKDSRTATTKENYVQLLSLQSQIIANELDRIPRGLSSRGLKERLIDSLEDCLRLSALLGAWSEDWGNGTRYQM